MKALVITASIVAFLGAPVIAAEGEDWDLATACKTYKTENPESKLDCACLVEKTGDNADLLAAYKAAATEDAELTEAAAAIVTKCTPGSEEPAT